MRDELLIIENLYKSFDGAPILDDVSITVKSQKVTGLIGPNGAGKSTIFSILTGLIKPDSGVVRLRGEDVAGLRACEIARLGVAYLMQEYVVFPEMTVLENVMTGFGAQGGEALTKLFFDWPKVRKAERERTELALGLLDTFHLLGKEQQKAQSLSVGEQKRVALARILASDADLLLLDEPISGLDPAFTEEMVSAILSLRDRGRTVFLIEHDVDFVAKICDYIYVLNHGRIIAKGTPEEITSDTLVGEAYLGS